jgi:hypothetical protein
MTSKVQAIKAKISQLNSIKQNGNNKMKWWPIHWDKIFANRISDKNLCPEYIKNSHNSVAKNKYLNYKKNESE